MRIQTLPPRLRWWVIVRRAASIWRAVIHAGSRVRMANSPKAMVLPREAMPPKPPWVRFIILRCFIRLGCNMRAYSPVLVLGGGVGGVEGRAQGMQRHAGPAVPRAAAHFRAAQASRDLHAHAFGAEALRALDGLLHGAAERHALFELIGDAAPDQRGVGFGLADLLD